MGGLTCEQCEAAVRKALQQPRPAKLLAAVNQRLGQSDKALEVECRKCDNSVSQGQARAFLAAPPPKIVICSNHIRSSSEVEEVLVHELVHAVDYCVDGQDLQDCRVLACSEIRAAREAECYRSFPLEWLRKRCVTSTATRSTQNMFPAQGAACVAEVFERCMADTRPFS